MSEPGKAHLWDFLPDSENRQAVAAAGPPPARKKALDDSEGFEDEELLSWKLGVGPADSSGCPVVYEGRLFSPHQNRDCMCCYAYTCRQYCDKRHRKKQLLLWSSCMPGVDIGMVAVLICINTKSQDRKNAMSVLQHSVAP